MVCGWLVLKTTFYGTDAERGATVRVWGFRGPLGAWVTIWGALALLASAPFDNWWHSAYGLDVKILSPPHSVLAAGMYFIVFGGSLHVSKFLLSPAADNWFFVGGRHWPFSANPEWFHRFWRTEADVLNLSAIAKVWGFALVSSALGLLTGSGMARVKR